MQAAQTQATTSGRRDREQVLLYGPLADLSGPDTSAPVSAVAASPRIKQPSHGLGRHGCCPHGAVARRAGYGRMPHGRYARGQEPAPLVIATPARFEHGVIPMSLQVTDGRGNVSSLTNVDVLVVGRPRDVVTSAVYVVSGAVRLSVTEWSDA